LDLPCAVLPNPHQPSATAMTALLWTLLVWFTFDFIQHLYYTAQNHPRKREDYEAKGDVIELICPLALLLWIAWELFKC
jgi:hypothetical protein